MVQLMSISKIRSNFSSLVTQVAATKKPIIILKESEPVAVIQPYQQSDDNENHPKKLLSLKTDWFDEKEYKKIRKEVESRINKLHHE